MGDQVLVKAMLNLGQSLRINVTAEGVESLEDLPMYPRVPDDAGLSFCTADAHGRVPCLPRSGSDEVAAAGRR